MYVLHLVNERHLAASSVIVAVAAVRFLYAVTLKRPWQIEDVIPAGKQAKKLPVVMSREEVAHFLAAVDNLKHRVILTVCYATGLRVSEAVRLTPRCHRQQAHGDPGNPGQGPQGPLRDAASEAARSAPGVLEPNPSRRLAVSRRDPPKHGVEQPAGPDARRRQDFVTAY